MHITYKYVPEGRIDYVTVTVKKRSTGEVFPANVIIANMEVPEGDEDWEYNEEAMSSLSEEFSMLLRTCVAMAPNVPGVLKALNDRGYGLVIEDGDSTLATSLVGDDISGLE